MDVAVTAVEDGLIIGFVFLLGLFFLSQIFRRSPTSLAPGAREWGSTWRILKAPWYDTLLILASEWAQRFGDITCVHSFGMSLVFLNSAETTRKLLASETYKFLVADKFQIPENRILEFIGKDLVFYNFDAISRKKRRLFYKVIGVYGDGVAKFEDVVWGEIQRMFTDIDLCEGKDTDLTSILTRSLRIIIYILVRGESPEDPTVPDILEEFNVAANKLGKRDVDFV